MHSLEIVGDLYGRIIGKLEHGEIAPKVVAVGYKLVLWFACEMMDYRLMISTAPYLRPKSKNGEFMSAIRKLKALYRQIPEIDIPCQGCLECCDSIVPWSWMEIEHLYQATNKYPMLKEGTKSCSFAEENSCTIYEYRPFMCRLFGTCDIPGYSHCEKGLRTSTPLTKDKVNELLDKYHALAKKNGGMIFPAGSGAYKDELMKMVSSKDYRILPDPEKHMVRNKIALDKLRMIMLAAFAAGTI